MTERLEETAQRIADRGRDALVARLRPAFEQAAASHADVLELSPKKLEDMVQRAADRADGLQWRRALAFVASEELDIGLGEALAHPAVARAQAILGAPSYEDSIAQLATARTGAGAGAGAGAGDTQVQEPAAGHDDEAAPDVEGAPQDQVVPDDQGAPDDQVAPDDDASPDERPEDGDQAEPAEAVGLEEPEALRLEAIHVAGIANLAAAEAGIELLLSDVGLDIIRGDEESLGRLTWSEVRSLSVTTARGRRRRRRAPGAQLVIRTAHGDATFEISDRTPEQLREQISPWSARTMA